jgi:hypothetical protein
MLEYYPQTKKSTKRKNRIVTNNMIDEQSAVMYKQHSAQKKALKNAG